MKLKQAWHSFVANHPRFPAFLSAVRDNGISAGTTVDITVTYPDGNILRSGIKVRPTDLELLELIASLAGGKQSGK